MDYKDINDYEIIYLVSENDDYVVDILYKKYQPLIDKKIKKWLNVGNFFGIEKEDIEQECYLAFTNAVRSFDDNFSSLFYSYVNSMIDGYFLNKYKKLNSDKCYINNINVISINKESKEDDFSNIECTLKSRTFIPDIELEYQLRIEKFKKFLYSLDIHKASIVELYINGYKSYEIANLLGIDKKNVSIEVSKILKKFRKNMEKSYSLVI